MFFFIVSGSCVSVIHTNLDHKARMDSYEKENDRIRKLLEEADVSSDETGDEDSGEEDFLEERNASTDTEQEISDVDSDNGIEKDDLDTYTGKDGETVWLKRELRVSGRTRAHNILTEPNCVKGSAKSAKFAKDCWKLFFDEDMMNILVECTNKYINDNKKNCSRDRDARTTSKEELFALIGLLYLAGIYKSGRQNFEDLWAQDGTGVELFHTTMSSRRFKYLLECLRFDDKSTRTERLKSDKLAPIREIFQMFVSNCQKTYSISEFGTIDEMLAAFRGRCSFRQYIPSKPDKYGIKLFALVDAQTFFTSKLEVYVGSQPDGAYKASNSPCDVVERLCSGIFGTGRNITLDNWFTSYDLAQKMLSHQITLVGTLRKNKRQIPPEFLDLRNRGEKTSLFGFRSDSTLLSYVPKKKKNVLILSTLHNNNKIDEETGSARKPEIVTFYNTTKGGVDTVDQMSSVYNCARNTRRWPMEIFYRLLNIASINGFIIYCKNGNEPMKRRKFLKKLCYELVQEHLKNRTTIDSLPKQLKEKLARVTNSGEMQNEPPRSGKRQRCYNCSGTDRKTKYYCSLCYKFLCFEHAKIVCKQCFCDCEN